MARTYRHEVLDGETGETRVEERACTPEEEARMERSEKIAEFRATSRPSQAQTAAALKAVLEQLGM